MSIPVAETASLSLDKLLTLDPRLPGVWAWVQQHMTPDAAHDEGHLHRVALWTRRCAPQEPVVLAVAAALTHDVVNLPKNHPQRAQASTLAAQAVQQVLPDLGFTPAQAHEVALAVRDHSFSRGAVPATPLGAALQDADRLDALGALGVMRVAAVGGHLGRAIFDAADPWCQQREPDDQAFTVDHFFTKLLRLSASFQTVPGRAEAQRRTAVMHAFLTQLGEEIGVPYPEP
ncbi:HD domain-containing protein [Deinococcus deserti]|uniref:Putative HD superfamily hydrolase n=1 Tax=Deinococcus deserti (strain DSM 17065 / CIP 109153 / LMG 22923 / VCD115) TaxID=546414 RepID=C1CYM5_DEIDV|nr:HD domain-containing protein [Deinococcus deserti]ACO47055.2 putative HD superfamily hydrolase [Deinococcus deserti VCD115]